VEGFEMPVTARQRQVYEFICRYLETNNQPPTIAEIGGQFQMTSSASVHSILSALEREGLIKRIPNVSRGIELVKVETPESGGDEFEVPLLGLVAAGQPIEAVLAHETVSAPKSMIGRGRMFALRVRGDSMIGRHILEGDLVVLEYGLTPHAGNVVAALIDDESTLKTFLIENGKPCLRAENPRYPKLIAASELVIQGVMVALIRKCR